MNSQTTKLISHVSTICFAALVAMPGAQAEDLQTLLPGPVLKSSATLSWSGTSSGSDRMLGSSPTKYGDYNYSSNGLSISGIYAYSPKLSFTGGVSGSSTVTSQNSTLLGTAFTDNKSQSTSVSLGGLANLVTSEDQKLKLNSSFQIQKSDAVGATTAFSASLNPQYEVNTDLMLGMRLGLTKQKDTYSSQFISATLAWRVAPKLWLLPNAESRQLSGSSTFSNYSTSTIGLSLSGALSNTATVFAGVSKRAEGDKASSNPGSYGDIKNTKATNFNLGTRLYF